MSVGSLVNLDRLRRDIEAARSIEELKEIRDKAEALREYGKKHGWLLEDQNNAAEATLRCARAMGELLEENARQQGETDKSIMSHHATLSPKLEDIGITRSDSSRCKAIAKLPEEKFEHHIAEVKDKRKELTQAGALQLAKSDQRQQKAQEVKASLASGNQHTDLQLMQKLEIPVQPYDVWNFAKCDERFGREYPGRIPGQLVAHCLYFWTEQGDIVLDPMAGGGTTIDVCKVLNRRVLAYDAHPCREDITSHNLAVQGWPNRTAEAKLIFWDPPYFKKKDDGYGEQSISRYNRLDYLAFFDRMAATIPTGFHGRLAFLMSDYTDDEHPDESIWFTDYANIFTAHGWHVERYIQVPLTTQSIHPDIVIKFRERKRLARLGRVMVVVSR